MYKLILRLETLLILFISSAYSSDSLKTVKIPVVISISQDSILIPTYEKYKFTKNYVFNQTVVNCFRWTTILAAAGATAGVIADAQEEYVFIPQSFIYGVAGSGLGLITGTVIGIVNGLALQKHAGSDFHKRRCRAGYEVNVFDVAPIAMSKATRMSDYPGFSLVYRTLSNKRFVPDEISLGLGNNEWYKSEPENTSGLYTGRVEGIVQFNFTSGKLLTPYWSVGAGYCWGEETDENRNENFNWYIEKHDIRSPLLRAYAGSELNLFDFFYGDLKIGYELIGPYIFAHDKKNFPYAQNLIVGLSVGTYIF
jgi:hypothetical protein